MNHIITEPENYYSEFIKENVTQSWRDKLKEFFSLPEVEKALKEKNYYKLYDIFSDELEDAGQSDLTRVLLAADIDFLPDVDTIPSYCFEGMCIVKVIIPKNIKKIRGDSFSGLAPGCIVEYEGTVDELNKLIENNSYYFIEAYIPKIICSDGEVTIE